MSANSHNMYYFMKISYVIVESSSPMMLKKKQIGKLTRSMLTVMPFSFSSLLKQKMLSRNCWYFQAQLLFGGSFMEADAWCKEVRTELTDLAFHR